MTLPQALDAFLLEQRLRGNTDKTVSGYRGFVTQFIAWLAENGVESAAALTLQHVQGYQLYLDGRRCTNKAKNLTKRTVRTYMRNIRIFLAYCFAENFITEPIHLKLKLPKAEKPVIEILTDEETTRIFGTFGNDLLAHRNRAMVCLMLDCGLRISEVVGICPGDINFDKGYVKVTGKGRKGRIVPIGETVAGTLREYMRSRPDTAADNFFLSVREKPLKPGGITQLMNRLKKKTGVPRLHAHLLRHTFATNFLIHGLGDVYELSRILGHGDIKITESYLQLASYYTILQNKSRSTYLDKLKAHDSEES